MSTTMLSPKSARVSKIIITSLMFLLTACGTKFRSLVPEIKSSASGSGAAVVVPPPAMPMGEPVLKDTPSSFNTGVPTGVTLQSSGALTITTPGAVIDSMDIKGVVHIKAANVTLRRSKVTVANYVQVEIDADLPGVRIEDCEISGVGTGNDGAMGIQGPGTFIRNNIHSVQTGIVPNSGALIQDNYIHDLQASGNPIYNGIQIEGGVDNVLIFHNAVINQAAQWAAVDINNFYGHVANVSGRGNLLSGGDNTVVCDGEYSSYALTAISFTLNTMRKGASGYKAFTACSPEFSGNVDDTTGAAIP